MIYEKEDFIDIFGTEAIPANSDESTLPTCAVVQIQRCSSGDELHLYSAPEELPQDDLTSVPIAKAGDPEMTQEQLMRDGAEFLRGVAAALEAWADGKTQDKFLSEWGLEGEEK